MSSAVVLLLLCAFVGCQAKSLPVANLTLVARCKSIPELYFLPQDQAGEHCKAIPVDTKPLEDPDMYVYKFQYTGTPGTIVSMCEDVEKTEERAMKASFLEPTTMFDKLKDNMVCTVMEKKRFIPEACYDTNPHSGLQVFDDTRSAAAKPKQLSVKLGEGVECCLVLQ